MTAVLVDCNVILDLMTEDPLWAAWPAAAVESAANTAEKQPPLLGDHPLAVVIATQWPGVSPLA